MQISTGMQGSQRNTPRAFLEASHCLSISRCLTTLRADISKLKVSGLQVLNDQRDNPIQGSVAGWQTVAGTYQDMRQSVFCVCPPGIAQQTLRMWRSIMSGCIPVTFFKAHDQPYEINSNLDYKQFSVNINPQEHHLLAPILKGILNNPAKLAQMQLELSKVQQMFIWDKQQKKGVFDMIFAELKQHIARDV